MFGWQLHVPLLFGCQPYMRSAFACIVTAPEFADGVAADIFAVLIFDVESDWKGAAVAALEWSNCFVGAVKGKNISEFFTT